MTPINITSIIQALAEASAMPKEELFWMLEALIDQKRSDFMASESISLASDDAARLKAWVARRKKHEPLAYILGNQPFYGQTITVNPSCLIPRASTECLVDFVLNQHPQGQLRIADLGTGSGAIAAALAAHRPTWHIDAVDKSEASLVVARTNLSQFPQVELMHGDWCEGLPAHSYDIIIANPPYVSDTEYAHSQASLCYEPRSALVSDHDGFSDGQAIAIGAAGCLRNGGCLVLEHGHTQQPVLMERLEALGYHHVQGHLDYSGHPRFISAKRQYHA